jgi:hypothetical protein
VFWLLAGLSVALGKLVGAIAPEEAWAALAGGALLLEEGF